MAQAHHSPQSTLQTRVPATKHPHGALASHWVHGHTKSTREVGPGRWEAHFAKCLLTSSQFLVKGFLNHHEADPPRRQRKKAKGTQAEFN